MWIKWWIAVDIGRSYTVDIVSMWISKVLNTCYTVFIHKISKTCSGFIHRYIHLLLTTYPLSYPHIVFFLKVLDSKH